MAGAKEIRTKIKSVQSTKKITKAMEMVAASKMRKTQNSMMSSRPYTEQIRNIAGHIAQTNPEYRHVYMEERNVRNVGYIIISTDRGLCGGLNINLFKNIISSMQQLDKKGIKSKSFLIGNKAEAFFKRVDTKVVSVTANLGDSPCSTDIIGGVKVMLEEFEQNKIDELYVCYNKFVNTMTQQAVIERILPVLPSEDLVHKYQWDYLYEPDAKTLLDFLLIRFVESLTYQSLIENIACEQASRMVAMKSASENATDVIDELQLIYNKARQASITQEISEIVGGAAAV